MTFNFKKAGSKRWAWLAMPIFIADQWLFIELSWWNCNLMTEAVTDNYRTTFVMVAA
jgi:hypothetical protein